MQKDKLIRKNKGITLVALVITIAIMLILAGVTISVSLKGGLFSTAKEATAEMQIEIEKEQLLTATLGAMRRDGTIVFSDLDSNLPDNFTKISEGKYESSTGNKYRVTEDADIILLDGAEEEPDIPDIPVVPPATPTITLSTTQITKEITSGAPETVQITATLNNASGDLTWTSSDTSIAETSGSGTTRTVTLKKAGTARITVSYGTQASATCNITVTEKETTPRYELSGIWEFNDTLIHTTEFNETVEISFTSNSTKFNSIDIYIIQYGFGETNLREISVVYGETDGALYAQYHITGEPIPTDGIWVEEGYKTIDFGSNPQPVSQEFYEWFNANATQVTQITFTIDGTEYTATGGQTWKDWISENNMIKMFLVWYEYDAGMIDTIYDVDDSESIRSVNGAPFLDSRGSDVLYGDIIVSDAYYFDTSGFRGLLMFCLSTLEIEINNLLINSENKKHDKLQKYISLSREDRFYLSS